MTYVCCPECGLKISGKYGFLVDSCPRCLRGQGRRVWMDAHLGSFRPDSRFVPAGIVSPATAEAPGAVGLRPPTPT
jgi:hypothetical protein